MTIEQDLKAFALELERLDQRLHAARAAYECEMCDIADALAEAHDRRAVLLAKANGIEVGTELEIMTPHVWHGRLISGLRIRVERITSGWEDAVCYHASVKTKAGWSKRWTIARSSDCKIANTDVHTDDE